MIVNVTRQAVVQTRNGHGLACPKLICSGASREAPVLQSPAPKREKELIRIQILLGLRAHKTELCARVQGFLDQRLGRNATRDQAPLTLVLALLQADFIQRCVPVVPVLKRTVSTKGDCPVRGRVSRVPYAIKFTQRR